MGAPQQRKVPTTPDDEAALVADIIELVRQFGRFGDRPVFSGPVLMSDYAAF